MAKKSRPLHDIFSTAAQQPVKTECRWIHRLINQRSFRIFVLIVVCSLNVIDLIVDWHFFVSKTSIDPGLVFGPPSVNIQWAIRIFCIISTLTSILEIIQVIRDTCQNRLTSLFGQITNCLTLWLEDVPLLTLNLLIVVCRDGEVTYVSLAKAIVGIVAAVIRFLSILLNKWLIRHDYQRKDRLSQFFNTTSTFGVVIVFILSICIHGIASLPIDRFGRIHLENPSDFTRFKFAHQKYFNNVGLFVRSPNEFDKYIYLTNIENIIENGSATFIYSVDVNENIFCLKQLNQTCFIESNDTRISLFDKPLTNKLINYSITFDFLEPDSYHLLGDIRYNIKRCDYKAVYIHSDKISFHYFRFKRHFHQSKLPVILNTDNLTYRYYDMNDDFESVEHTWRTGLFRCTSTSSYSPHWSDSVIVNDCPQ